VVKKAAYQGDPQAKRTLCQEEGKTLHPDTKRIERINAIRRKMWEKWSIKRGPRGHPRIKKEENNLFPLEPAGTKNEEISINDG